MDSDLFAAAISGNKKILKMRHAVTGVETQLTPTKNTVLHLASESGEAACVEQILIKYADLLCKTNSKGETALHVAVRGGHLKVVRVLLDYAKKASSSDKSKKDVHLQLIRMLNEEQESALHEAVRYDHVEIVKFLIEKDPEDEHSPNKHHMSPLYLATLKGHVASVNAVFANCKQPPGIKTTDKGPDGRTLLHAAVMSGSTECVRCIVRQNLNLTIEKDNNGWTALHYAAYFNFSGIIKDITDEKKYVAYETDKTAERTALHIAAQLGKLAALAHRDALNKDSLTPLDLVRGRYCESGSEQEKVQNLLEQIGAVQNLNLKNTLDMYKPLPRQNATDERLEITRKLSRTRMFIVAFIATITLAIAANLINLPGGNMYQDSRVI
ncbi:hypothetical protein POM88_018795 [Heracleum sosnowskyi]|uniref:PGG domain-containing protein n=1 Tax=Heracleum sosnowskyi TaxID=360622 RepID=A0AAD8MZP7_9APIA|nr:hypothetical protein POM88_018795 [Heracleum sosnowskyi]